MAFNPNKDKLKQSLNEALSQSVIPPKSNRTSKKAASNYNKKGRYPFSLHHDVRYDKLEELVEYHQAKSASDYLENLIIREWERMQRKLKK